MTSMTFGEMLNQFGDGGGGGDFVHLEPNDYKLRVASAKKKNDGIFLVLTVVEGPYTGQSIGSGFYPGKDEKGHRAFFSKMISFGIEKAWLAQVAAAAPGKELEYAAKALEGRVAICKVSDNVYNGETRSQIGFNNKVVEAPALPAIGGIPSVAPPTVPAPAPVTAPVAAPAPSAVSVAEAAPVAAVPAPVAAVPVAPAPAVTAPVAAAVAPVAVPVTEVPVAAAVAAPVAAVVAAPVAAVAAPVAPLPAAVAPPVAAAPAPVAAAIPTDDEPGF